MTTHLRSELLCDPSLRTQGAGLPDLEFLGADMDGTPAHESGSAGPLECLERATDCHRVHSEALGCFFDLHSPVVAKRGQ